MRMIHLQESQILKEKRKINPEKLLIEEKVPAEDDINPMQKKKRREYHF
jgi:hypothetical protein